MMNTREIIKRVAEHSDLYLREVEALSMERLTWKERDEDWSLGQMYLHLINTALYMQLNNVETCISKEQHPPVLNAGKSEVGETVFSQGAIPPIRIQVPASPQYTPPQPESKEQIVKGFQTVLQRMEETAPRLDARTSLHKVMHPGFGALDAREWFALIEMHYRHHFLQQERLKNAWTSLQA